MVLDSEVGGGMGGPRGPQADAAPADDAQADTVSPQPAAGADNAAIPNPMGGFGGRGQGDGPGGRSVTLDKANVTDQWPLFRYLLDAPTYYASYVGYLQETLGTVFLPDQLTAQYGDWEALLAPYVDDESAFTTAVESLTEHTYERAQAVETFLDEQ